jgi:large subunit ribosomal protein L27
MLEELIANMRFLGEPVVPGNIIFRQRGTKWFPGENCGIGRDHTIFALAKGFVRYYKDPFKHPKRKYIGVALTKEDDLPTLPTEPRRRRLGMDAVPLFMPEPDSVDVEDEIKPRRAKDGTLLRMGKNYAFSVTNWEIGRIAEREGVTKRVRPFDHKDRWLAWTKRVTRRKANTERIALMGSGKKKKNNKQKNKAAGLARAQAMSKK